MTSRVNKKGLYIDDGILCKFSGTLYPFKTLCELKLT